MVYYATSIPVVTLIKQASARHYAAHIPGMAWSTLAYMHSTTIAYLAYHGIAAVSTMMIAIAVVLPMPRYTFKDKMRHLEVVGRRDELYRNGYFDAENTGRFMLEYPNSEETLRSNIHDASLFAGRYMACLAWIIFVGSVSHAILDALGMWPIVSVFAATTMIYTISSIQAEVKWSDLAIARQGCNIS